MGINRAVTKYLSRVFDWIARGVQKIKYKFQVRRANAPDRAARRTANATWVIALFTAVTTVVGFAQWRALHHTDERIGQQVEAMGRALTLMESDQRPWIKISDVKLVTPVTFNASGGSAAISIEAINVGKSVALNVYPSADMYVFTGGKYSHAVPTITGETCHPDTMPLKALSAAGESIFPNEPINWSHAISIERKEIDAAKDKVFFVVVCIDYRVGDTHYKTGVHYSINERTPEGWRFGIIGPTEGKIIELENLRLDRIPNSFAR